MNKEQKKFKQTYSKENLTPFTIEDLKKYSDMACKQEEKELPRGLHWFTKLMNKFGWHRKYELIVVDKEKFRYNPFLKPPKL